MSHIGSLLEYLSWSDHADAYELLSILNFIKNLQTRPGSVRALQVGKALVLLIESALLFHVFLTFLSFHLLLGFRLFITFSAADSLEGRCEWE